MGFWSIFTVVSEERYSLRFYNTHTHLPYTHTLADNSFSFSFSSCSGLVRASVCTLSGVK